MKEFMGLAPKWLVLALTVFWLDGTAFCQLTAAEPVESEVASGKWDPVEENLKRIKQLDVKPLDWPMWGGSALRNNVPMGQNIPTQWDVESGDNIKWTANLGSQSYGNPVVANGKVYVGTNNGAGYIEKYPATVDLGCLICFDEQTGEFLWQHSNEKLKTGRVHDWPLQGICCSPLVDGSRLWYVSNRGEILCLDTEGFRDGENDGPFKEEPLSSPKDADVIWKVDMMSELGISQHNMCSCSIAGYKDLIFVCTGNGVDESHLNIPAPEAPSFMCLDRNTGKIYWMDKSPGINILHGQWSSPTVAVLGGVPQVMFAGGDSWLYSFRAERTESGKPELLWKFDTNPKDTVYILGGRGTRNELICTPTVYDGLVYIAVGQDPEHGEGIGHLWCIDPTKRGDISPELAFDAQGKPLPTRRLQAIEPSKSETSKPNPNSGVVWHYHQADYNDDGEIAFEEEMHRTIGSAAIKDDILYIADFSGIFHCVDAKTGKQLWNYDMLAACWSSPLVVDDHVYIGDEDGDVTIFKHGRSQEVVSEINMGSSVYSSAIVANNTLFIANRTTLFAITNKE